MKCFRSLCVGGFVPRCPISLSLAVFAAVLFAGVAEAHPGHEFGTHDSWQAGLGHPWLGVDHVIAMVVVGLLASTGGKHRLWWVPSAFIVSMTGGGVLGYQLGNVMGMPWAVALSVVALGIGLVRWRAIGAPRLLWLVAVAGVVQGWLHGANVAGSEGFASYQAGLVIATMILHATGLAVGIVIRQTDRAAALLKAAGGVAAAAGVWALLALL
jgi:urease accessory protein